MKLEDAIKSNRFTDEKHRATLNILYTAYWLRDIFSSVLKEQCGLTVEQHNVLRILKGSAPNQMCVKEIGSRMIEKSSNVPRIIDRLVAKKLVKRTQSKEDKRETLVSLTEKGSSTTDIARKLLEDTARDHINITEEEATALDLLLEKMRATPDEE